MKAWTILIFFTFVFVHQPALSQKQIPDSLATNPSFDSLLFIFQNEIASQLHLYIGSEYLISSNGIKGTAFFKTNDFLRGSVYFEGRAYRNILMQYDMVLDEVVVRDYSNNYTLALAKEKTMSFVLLDHHYFHLIPDSANNLLMEGFYDNIFSGAVQVWVQRSKRLENSHSTESNEDKYIEYNNVYLKKDDRYYLIRNVKSILAVLKDRKSILKQYIKENRIKFGKEPEDGILMVVRYYSQQIN